MNAWHISFKLPQVHTSNQSCPACTTSRARLGLMAWEASSIPSMASSAATSPRGSALRKVLSSALAAAIVNGQLGFHLIPCHFRQNCLFWTSTVSLVEQSVHARMISISSTASVHAGSADVPHHLGEYSFGTGGLQWAAGGPACKRRCLPPYLADGTSHSSGFGHTGLYRCCRHNALASQQPIERGVQCDDCQTLRIQLKQVWPVLVTTQCHVLRLLNNLQIACGQSGVRYHTLCWKHSTRCQTFG